NKIVARSYNFDYDAPEAFDEWDTIKTVDQIGKIFDTMNLFLGSVGLVTLALGAIGIINIMLVAVADRTHEIGLRKALGATKGSIMFQFFIEGAFLTIWDHFARSEDFAGVYWHDYSWYWRDRTNEHYACLGHSAYARNRRREGSGRAQT